MGCKKKFRKEKKRSFPANLTILGNSANNLPNPVKAQRFFVCHNLCPGEIIYTTYDFLSYFVTFYMKELGLLHENILKYLLQPSLQTAIFAECEYVEEKKETERRPASNPVSNANEIHPFLGVAKITIDELSKVSGTIALLKKTTAELLLKNKSLEANLCAKNAALCVYEYKTKDMLPCYDIGVAICCRKMAKNLPLSKQNREIILRENSAAHGGTAIADTSLFFFEKKNEKVMIHKEAFSKLYGLEPTIVRRFHNCEKFIEMMNFRGAMKIFRAKEYEASPFNRRFVSCLSNVMTLVSAYPITVEAEQALIAAFKQKLFVSDLEFLNTEYETAKIKNAEYYGMKLI